MTPTEVRLIQLADACCRLWDLVPAALLPLIHHYLNSRECRLIARHSDAGSDSPAETSLRLALTGLAEGMVTQHRIFIDNRLISVADIAWPRLKVLVYYDGGHHGERPQWETDNALSRALLQAGYIVLRYTRAELSNLTWIRHNVSAVLQSAQVN